MLSARHLEPESAAALAEAALPALRTLFAFGCAFGDAGWEALAGARWLPRVELLELASTGATARGVRALFAHGAPLALRHLVAGNNVARSGGVPPSRNLLDDEAAQVLADSPRLPALAKLDLSRTGITDVGARALATSPRLPALRELALWHSATTDAAARVFEHERPGLRVDVSYRGGVRDW